MTEITPEKSIIEAGGPTHRTVLGRGLKDTVRLKEGAGS